MSCHVTETSPDSSEQINEALRRLAMRQKQRQYSASKGSSVLHQSRNNSAKPNDQSFNSFPFPEDMLPPRPVQTNVVLKHSKDHKDSGATYPPEESASATLVGENKTAAMTASDTFHEFVNNVSYAGDAAATTNGGYQTLAGSLQQQQIKQKRMLEQSKALLEQSKAKHQEMVAQAHAAHRSRQPDTANGADEPAFLQIYAPKPPPRPSSVKKPTSSHRIAR